MYLDETQLTQPAPPTLTGPVSVTDSSSVSGSTSGSTAHPITPSDLDEVDEVDEAVATSLAPRPASHPSHTHPPRPPSRYCGRSCTPNCGKSRTQRHSPSNYTGARKSRTSRRGQARSFSRTARTALTMLTKTSMAACGFHTKSRCCAHEAWHGGGRWGVRRRSALHGREGGSGRH